MGDLVVNQVVVNFDLRPPGPNCEGLGPSSHPQDTPGRLGAFAENFQNEACTVDGLTISIGTQVALLDGRESAIKVWQVIFCLVPSQFVFKVIQALFPK